MTEFEEKILSMLETVIADITELKKDVAELKQGQAELYAGYTELRKDVNELRKDVNELKKDVTKLKEDVAELKQGQVRLESAIDSLKLGQAFLKQHFNILEQQMAENQKSVDETLHLAKLIFETQSDASKKYDAHAKLYATKDEVDVIRLTVKQHTNYIDELRKAK